MAKRIQRQLLDVHAHLLPGIDDGARTMEEACELVKMAIKVGFSGVIATPHYSRRRGVEGLAELREELQERVKAFSPDFKIYLGQETYYHEELPERLMNGDALTMAGSRYVLVEFDPDVGFLALERAARRLIDKGYVPVLAHMERYVCLRKPEYLERLYQSACLMQMNYECLSGHFFQSDVCWCRKQVKSGHIHFLGTDMHRIDYRSPEIEDALKWLERHIDSFLLREMTYGNASRMVKNEKIG